MRSLLQLVLLASCLLGVPFVGAVPTKDCPYSVKETIQPPRTWIKHGVPPPNHKIVLRIGLPQPNFSVLEKHLYEVSDPDHERYGQHLSKAEVEELVAPHQESLDSVNEWLSSFGITEKEIIRSPAKDWVTIRLPVNVVEKMLDTVSPLVSIFQAHILTVYRRNTMFGNMPKPESPLSGPPATVSQLSFTSMLMLFNQRPCSDGLRKKGQMFSASPL